MRMSKMVESFRASGAGMGSRLCAALAGAGRARRGAWPRCVDADRRRRPHYVQVAGLFGESDEEMAARQQREQKQDASIANLHPARQRSRACAAPADRPARRGQSSQHGAAAEDRPHAEGFRLSRSASSPPSSWALGDSGDDGDGLDCGGRRAVRRLRHRQCQQQGSARRRRAAGSRRRRASPRACSARCRRARRCRTAPIE